MEEKMSKESPILGEVFKPLDEQKEGSGYGARLTYLDLKEAPNRLKLARKFLPAGIAIVATLGTLKGIQEIDFSKIASASELGPTPRILPAPGETIREAREFDEKIRKVNQEPGVVMSQTTPTATEIQQKETPIPEKAGVEGIQISEIPPSTATTLYFLWAPITVGQVAEKLKMSEEEFLSHNKFLLKECEVDLKYCPYVSFDQKILMGNRFVALPREYMDVDEVSSIRSSTWPLEVLEKGAEGRVFSVQSNSYSIRATLMGLNIETGNFVVEIGNNNYSEVHQDQFLVDLGFAPERIMDGEFGEGLRWQLESYGEIIYIETYNLPEELAQNTALDIKNYLPLVQKYCRFDVNKIKRIIYTTGVSSDEVTAEFAGISCENEGDKCRILIKRDLVFDAPAHELCHAGNYVQLGDGSWIPAYSRIIDEGVAAYVDDIRKAPYRNKQLAHLFGDDEMLEQNNIEKLRSEVLFLDFNNEETLSRYGTLTEYSGWAIWEINQTAIEGGKPEFLAELITAARELARKEKRRVTGYDLVRLAEEIWPGEGASLVNNYNVLFIRAAWEEATP
jgi:hypothetical protein